MREIRPLIDDIDRYLEQALRAKQQVDAERWRNELRPRALRLFVVRASDLTWSCALVKLVVAPRLLPTVVPSLIVPDHHTTDSPARLDPVKALRCAPPRAAGLTALTGLSVEPGLGSYVMVGQS